MKHLVMMIGVQDDYELFCSHSNVSSGVKSLWTTLDSGLVQKILQWAPTAEVS